MLKIPLQQTPAQSLKVKLANQNCEMRVYYRFGSTYLDLTVDGVVVCTGAICRNRQSVVQIANNAFQGSLFFLDMLGQSDPLYSGFGERWRLFYMTAAEYASRKTVELPEEKIVMFLPYQDGTLEYNGNEQSPRWKNYNRDELVIVGDLSEINAGVYQATATPLPGYRWYDGTISAKPISWTIERQSVIIPTVSEPLVYDGDEQTITIENFDPSIMTVTGDTSATDAGVYTLTFSLIDTFNYKWEDGTSENKNVSWLIQKKNIPTPQVVNTVKTYNGDSQSPTIMPYDTDAIAISGDESATNAGTYALFFSLTSNNYQWADGTTGLKVVQWYIKPQTVSVPTVTDTIKTYNGAAQSPTISAYDSNIIDVTGDSATDAGGYNVVFRLVDGSNYIWDDETTGAKYAAWSISPKVVPIPTITDTSLTYDGTAQSPTIGAYDPNEVVVGGDTSATNAGTYTITLSLTSTTNYVWSDTTTEPIDTPWIIVKLSLSVPTLSDASKTYNGSSQSPTISAYDANYISAAGDLSATNVGNYTITFSLLDTVNTEWSDSTTADKTASWSISALSVAIPYLTDDSKTYNTAAQSPTQNGFDSSYMTRTGTQSATNAGTYTITYSLIDTVNTEWSDNTTAAKVCTWTISPKSVTIPTMTNKSKTYSGSSQSPTISAFSATEITQTGTASATNAGTYTVYWNLTSTTNYKWSDNSTTQKSDTWTIAKAAGSLSISPTSLSLGISALTGTIDVTRSGNGTISAVSSNTSVATVSISGTTITITAVATGNATITVSVAEGTNYLAPTNKTASVAVQLVFGFKNSGRQPFGQGIFMP